jgi:radical SAM superfamily enzyme YgiQ (UPF0313 family)
MKTKGFNDYAIDIGPMGPIGEGEALILRATRNCPWNRCLFCRAYKNRKFVYRNVPEIKKDINTIKRIAELVEEASWRVGFGGRTNGEVFQEVIYAHPEIYGRDNYGLTPENYIARRSLSNVANWLIHSQRRVFLQDANTLIMRPRELTEVLRYLKETFPTVEIITSYARSKTCAQRALSELEELKQAGLSWLFVGVESGCDEVLKFMQKGVTAEEHIEGGQKVIQAGINLAAFVMPGLAGRNGELAEKHVSETTRVLNEIKPNEVRIRSLTVLEDSPLYAKWESGEFEPPTEEQMIEEMRLLIENLKFDCIIETLQMTNVLFNIRGRLSARKEGILGKITQYKAMSPTERLKFRLNKYLYGGYLDFVSEWGKLDSQLSQLIQEAAASLEKGAPDAETKIEQAIFAIKSKGIP